MDPVVIVGAKRTPLGVFQGALSPLSTTDLGTTAVQGALAQGNVAPEEVRELYMGCVLGAGLGQAPARQVIFSSGLRQHVSGTTLNKVCGSGLKSVMMVSDGLLLKRYDVAIAGVMESMSNASYLLDRARAGYRLGHQKILDHIFYDGLEDSVRKGCLMGVFAEETTQRYGFTRQQQDAFAIASATRVLNAIQQSVFQREMIPVSFQTPKGFQVVSVDETPSRIQLDKVPLLKPAFQAEGTVTAANSSSLADGAAALFFNTPECC